MDEIQTIIGPRHLEGWRNLCSENSTRAAVLQALINLEMEGKHPTQKEILLRVIEDGLQFDGANIPIKLSPKSEQAVSRHINHPTYGLIAQGFIVNVAGEQPETKGVGRGGPSSPWRSTLNLVVVR